MANYGWKTLKPYLRVRVKRVQHLIKKLSQSDTTVYLDRYVGGLGVTMFDVNGRTIHDLNLCGTPGCVAGHIVYEFGESSAVVADAQKVRLPDGRKMYFSKYASHLIGFNPHRAIDKLGFQMFTSACAVRDGDDDFPDTLMAAHKEEALIRLRHLLRMRRLAKARLAREREA